MKKTAVYIFLGVWLLLCQSVRAQSQSPRRVTSFNDDWQFTLDEPEKGNWKPVDIPHTWNNEDPFDEKPGYLRTVGWYRKIIKIDPVEDKQYILEFEAANQVAEVYVNSSKAGDHIGGYTAFTVDITPHLTSGRDTITVRVDNRHDEDIPPLRGDFNFYGGIYRDIWLIELNDIHFDFGKYAASGIFITTPQVSDSIASVNLETHFKNETGENKNLTIVHRLLDPKGKPIAEQVKEVSASSGKNTIAESFESIESPQLWHPDHPKLYTLISEIQSDEKVLDRLSTSFGFRWFRFDADSGFYLNGSPQKLMGVNRHQDYKGKGNALSNVRHRADMQLVKATGANFLRTAHYPQDPAILESSDRLGLLVSMEIPVDHEITDSRAFYENAVRMQREMIRQNYNHPSVIIWAYMNEMLLGRSWEEDRDDIEKITAFAEKMETLTRQEDSTRYTMIPNHGNFELYHKAGLTDIPMIVGWNLYFGWYESELGGLGKFLDHHHKVLPKKPTLITEYGAGADPRIRTQNPIRFDFSIEWQNRFLQSNLQQVMERPFVAGAAVWNLFDFGSESRNDAVPQINSKGLMTFDRRPKDAYHLLQSWLNDEPFVRIGSREWTSRSGKITDEEAKTSSQTIPVYGNTKEAELFHNGQSLGAKPLKDHAAEWEVPFRDGRNFLGVESDSEIQDQTVIDFNVYSPLSDTFQDIYINTGANFYFRDKVNGILWQPDEPYKNGFWGYRGGQVFQPRNRGIGADADILGTERDPLFQTQRVAPGEYVFDVPKGRYEVIFLFANLAGNENSSKKSVFDIVINGELVLDDLRLDNHKKFRAVERKVITRNEKDQLIISFQSSGDEAVVNGIGIRKIE